MLTFLPRNLFDRISRCRTWNLQPLAFYCFNYRSRTNQRWSWNQWKVCLFIRNHGNNDKLIKYILKSIKSVKVFIRNQGNNNNLIKYILKSIKSVKVFIRNHGNNKNSNYYVEYKTTTTSFIRCGWKIVACVLVVGCSNI